MMKFKQKHWLLGALLMMTVILGTAFPAFADPNSGVLDTVNGEGACGWAWNSADPAASVEVKVVITNQATKQIAAELTTAASSHREDLAARRTGTGNYGFHVTIPWTTFEDGSYLVEAYANGHKLSNIKVYSVGNVEAMSSPEKNSSLRSLGVFKTTAYCPCYSCSEGWGRHTSSGAIATSSHTIAVDPRVIPYGSKIMIDNVIYTAEDRGGGVKGNHIDIFFNTHGETRSYGTRSAEVFLVQ